MDSILSQGYPGLEYVVLDGGSRDGSDAIIRRAARHLTAWRSRPDDGQYAAVAEGLEGTDATILGWLNADDMLHPLALRKVADAFLSHPETRWLTGRPTAFDASGRVTWVRPDLPRWTPDIFYAGDFRAFIQQESTFFTRELWQAAGADFCKDFPLAGDFDLWLRFFRLTDLRVVDRLLGGYRMHVLLFLRVCRSGQYPEIGEREGGEKKRGAAPDPAGGNDFPQAPSRGEWGERGGQAPSPRGRAISWRC